MVFGLLLLYTAYKLARHDDTRAELARSPDQMAAVRDLIQQSGLAA